MLQPSCPAMKREIQNVRFSGSQCDPRIEQGENSNLQWQGKSAIQVVDSTILAETRGVPKVVVKSEGKTVASGLFELIGWLEIHGLIRM